MAALPKDEGLIPSTYPGVSQPSVTPGSFQPALLVSAINAYMHHTDKYAGKTPTHIKQQK